MEKILFFDGVCVMCNSLVSFVLKYDTKHLFKFATLQGNAARERIPGYTHGDLKTVVLVDESGIHTESDAIIGLLIGLGGLFKAAMLLKIFPKKIRDYVYRFIAKNRYRWFGQTEHCALLTKEQRAQIID
jgi:predicted DCC family thiol-disulfide oxidoreductase YuxK